MSHVPLKFDSGTVGELSVSVARLLLLDESTSSAQSSLCFHRSRAQTRFDS